MQGDRGYSEFFLIERDGAFRGFCLERVSRTNARKAQRLSLKMRETLIDSRIYKVKEKG